MEKSYTSQYANFGSLPINFTPDCAAVAPTKRISHLTTFRFTNKLKFILYSLIRCFILQQYVGELKDIKK